MSRHMWLVAVFVLLALSECAQMAAGQEHAPAPIYPSDNGPDRHGDMM
jgi:hypothetical protein